MTQRGPINLSSEYAGPLARLYDTLHADDNDENFWIGMARASKDVGPVLELGCGTGRLTVPLAKSGLEIHGIDASGDMLDIVNEKLAAEPEEVQERVNLYRASFDTFELSHRYGLVFFSSDTFRHLVGTDVQLAALARIKRHLAPGGRLVIDHSVVDVRTALEADSVEQNFVFGGPDGEEWHVALVPKIDVARGLLTDIVQVEKLPPRSPTSAPRGRKRQTAAIERYRARADMALMFPRELFLLLRTAGFKVVEKWSSYKRAEFSGAEDQLIVVVEPA